MGEQRGPRSGYSGVSDQKRNRAEVRGLGRRQLGWGLPGLWKDLDFNSYSGRSEEQALSKVT